MKLTILFPAYFPSLIWWQKAVRSDIIVLLNDQPIPRRGHINRCRIKSADGPVQLSVPIILRGRTIADCAVDETKNWYRTHRASLEINYRNAPYFEHYFPYFARFYENPLSTLLEVNFAGLELVDGLLRLSKEWRFHSYTPTTGTREERVLALLRKYKCDTYVIEEHHQSYFNSQYIREAGFFVETVTPNVSRYNQQFGDFIPGLSVLDVLFNEGPYALLLMEGKSIPYSET